MRNARHSLNTPSRLEQLVIDFLWKHGPSTSQDVREGLLKRHPMKEATVRTVLRRLEAKGYATHVLRGRTFVYSGVRPDSFAMRTVRYVIDRFWGGSAQALVAGMVEHEVIDPKELREFSKKLDELLKQKTKEKGAGR